MLHTGTVGTLEVPQTFSLEREIEREYTKSMEPVTDIPANTGQLTKKRNQPLAGEREGSMLKIEPFEVLGNTEKSNRSVRETRDADDKEESESEIWDKIIDAISEQ